MLFNYIGYFKVLRPNSSGGYQKPYKPALLLAVIEGIETGAIQNNKIYITPELIASFRNYRELLGASTPYQIRHFVYPFYHLKSEDFWQLKEQPEKRLVINSAGSVTSMKQLREAIDYARLDLSLWQELAKPKARNILRDVLLGTYTAPVEAS